MLFVYPPYCNIGNNDLELHARALGGINSRLRVTGRLSKEQTVLLNELKINLDTVYDSPFSGIVKECVGCDYLLFASTYEGFVMPIVDAHSVGRPVITSNTCSMPEVENEAALLVDPKSVEDIRSAIKRCMEEAPFRDALIAKGFESAKRFEPSKIAQDYIKVYEGLLTAEGSSNLGTCNYE